MSSRVHGLRVDELCVHGLRLPELRLPELRRHALQLQELHATCDVSRVTCRMPHVTCQLSRVACHVSHVCTGFGNQVRWFRRWRSTPRRALRRCRKSSSTRRAWRFPGSRSTKISMVWCDPPPRQGIFIYLLYFSYFLFSFKGNIFPYIPIPNAICLHIIR